MNNHGAHEREHELGASTAGSARLAEALIEIVRAHAPAGAGRWIDDVFAETSSLAGERFTTAFTAAARRVGRRALELDPGAQARLRWAGAREVRGAWSLDELARAALLLCAAAARAPAELERLVTACYESGDNRERRALLRALPLLPRPERFVPLAVDACRTSIAPLFEAVACENPYPAAYFAELNFNQMVLKALFIGVSLRRIVGLEARITPELQRMAADYASERRAAGRAVPDDIDWLRRRAST